ncbi:UDP-N-acetylglucosamine acyltransferase [Chitinispirillum alkaliphilum]|nr:UDP-N-acetylglucosamine acyltransferase [Chitinispirillum alkaliphilum]
MHSTHIDKKNGMHEFYPDCTVIHPTAVVSELAHIDTGARVGPYSIIEDNVHIGSGSVIGPHVVIKRNVRIGKNNKIHSHSVLGDTPQDISFIEDEPTWLIIGDRNVIREGVTIHRSTSTENPTMVGSDCFFMAYAHIAHDCVIQNGVILTNNVALGGYVEVGEKAFLGGAVVVHQFCRIGCFSMTAGQIAIRRDVLPYSLIGGCPVRHFRLNTIGLRRAGLKGKRYRALEIAFRALRKEKNSNEFPLTAETELLRSWYLSPSKRGVYGFASSDEADSF